MFYYYYYFFFSWEEQQILKLMLLTIPPTELDDVPSVDLILDPSCSYRVK